MNINVNELMKSIMMEDVLPSVSTPDAVGYTLKQTADNLVAGGNPAAGNAIQAGIDSQKQSFWGQMFSNDTTPAKVDPVQEETQSRILPQVNQPGHLTIDKLSAATRQLVEKGLLVLVREYSDERRTIGSLWFNKVPVGYTVEDTVRQSKVKGYTAVPAYTYNIGLRTTARTQLNRCAIPLNGQLVLPAIGTDAQCVNISVGQIRFAGCRIHDGVDESWSEGCIIYSDKEVQPGKLVQNPRAVQELSRVIMSNHINKIYVINEFEAKNAA